MTDLDKNEIFLNKSGKNQSLKAWVVTMFLWVMSLFIWSSVLSACFLIDFFKSLGLLAFFGKNGAPKKSIDQIKLN